MPHTKSEPTMAAMEREFILHRLHDFDGNRTRTAKSLQISIRSLRIKLHDYAEAGSDVPTARIGIKGSKMPREFTGSHAY
jgi:two-component system response regulator FlrC